MYDYRELNDVEEKVANYCKEDEFTPREIEVMKEYIKEYLPQRMYYTSDNFKVIKYWFLQANLIEALDDDNYSEEWLIEAIYG